MSGARKCDHDAVLADVKRGLPYKDIGKAHGISEKTVSRIAVRAGIVRHPEKAEDSEAAWLMWFYAEWDEVTARLRRRGFRCGSYQSRT